MAKNIHIKVYCAHCGHMLKEEVQDPVLYKNFVKIEVELCPGCLETLTQREPH